MACHKSVIGAQHTDDKTAAQRATDAALERDRQLRQQFAILNTSGEAQTNQTSTLNKVTNAEVYIYTAAEVDSKKMLKAVVTDPKIAAQRATDEALERDRRLREEFATDCSKQEADEASTAAKQERSMFFGDVDAAEPDDV